MAESEFDFKSVVIKFHGEDRSVVCHRPNECNAIAAIMNLMTFSPGNSLNYMDASDVLDGEALLSEVAEGIHETLEESSKSGRTSEWDTTKEETLQKIAMSLHKRTVLDPINQCCDSFNLTDEQLIFKILDVEIYHGWLLDPQDKDLSFVSGLSHSDLTQLISELQKANGDESLIQRLNDFKNAAITPYGLRCTPGVMLAPHDILHEALVEKQVAILYAKEQFNVLYKFEGDLFTLEASSKRFPNAIWKKLSVEQEGSFHVNAQFKPTKGQQLARKNLAEEWFTKKVLGDKIDLSKSKEETDNDPTSASSHPISDTCRFENSADVGRTTSDDTICEQSPQTIAERFLEFLTKFEDGSSKTNVPYFQGIAAGIMHTSSFKLYVPFQFIEKYNRTLAIEIQDGCPGIHSELEGAVVTYLINCQVDIHTAVLVKLEIQNLPEPKTNQKFLQFVSENEMATDCEMYAGLPDCTTTPVGRNMGRGFIDHMFDNFEEGYCWSEKWSPDEMESRNKGTEFILTKKADAKLTPELGVANLYHLIDTILPHYYTKNGLLPVFFNELIEDIMLFPDPIKDPRAWKRFVQYMRSHLALKAPLVRSTLICEAHRVLSVRLGWNSVGLDALIKRGSKAKDWRKMVRKVEPFSGVYSFKNNLSAGLQFDKWEISHWHVLKFTRNFIEHVMNYLKKLVVLHDPIIVELLVARRLEKYIADSIRTIVIECGVDGLFSATWGHFEASNSNAMPLEFTPNQIARFFSPQLMAQEATELDVKLKVHVSSIKSGDGVSPWSYTEVYRPSSDSSAQKIPSLDKLKQLLESSKLTVELSVDDSNNDDCVMISKITKAEECKVAVQGPLCREYCAILDILTSWCKASSNGEDCN